MHRSTFENCVMRSGNSHDFYYSHRMWSWYILILGSHRGVWGHLLYVFCECTLYLCTQVLEWSLQGYVADVSVSQDTVKGDEGTMVPTGTRAKVSCTLQK